jgi:tryptophanyl-tRNA synthetase
MAPAPKVVLTGDRPTGPLHLGHLYGSLEERVKLQEDPKYQEYILIADAQAYTDHADQPEKIRDHVLEVMLDYLSVGIDPAKATIFVQTGVPQIHELSIYLMNLISLKQVLVNPTVKTEVKQKGMGEAVPAGFAMYPVHQAADILIVKGQIVPVGDDQKPMIELARELVRKFNATYDKVFPEPQSVTPKGGRLSGTDGGAKMSKTIGNTISLSDSADTVAKKVQSMYTDPNHIHAKDPGKVKGNVVFEYLDVFDPEQKEVAELKAQYKKGGLGDVVLKKRLTEVLNDLLDPIRARRKEYESDPGEVLRLLEDGTVRTREVAEQTIAEVRRAMRLDYFS